VWSTTLGRADAQPLSILIIQVDFASPKGEGIDRRLSGGHGSGDSDAPLERIAAFCNVPLTTSSAKLVSDAEIDSRRDAKTRRRKIQQ
jgi:hypothetical protein